MCDRAAPYRPETLRVNTFEQTVLIAGVYLAVIVVLIWAVRRIK
jgi:hypothetical protein